MTSPTLVAEAPDELSARIWVDALRDAGIAATTFERGTGAALGGAASFGARWPIVVDPSQVAAARSVIAEIAGAAPLAPLRDGAAAHLARQRALLVVLGIVGAGVAAALLARLLA